jgi:hypothetical protein
MTNRFLRVAGLTLGLLLFVSSGVRADNWSTGFTTSNQTVVDVTYTNSTATPPAVGNTSGPEQTWAVPFTMTDTGGGQLPLNTQFTGFCIDLYHNVASGNVTTDNPQFVSVAGAQGAGVGATGTTASPFPNYSAYTTDFGSKLNYLGALYNQLTTAYPGDAYIQGAVQLAVWTLLDAQFKASGEATGMANDLAAIMKLVGGTAANGAADSTFYTYNETDAGAAVTISGLNAYNTDAIGHYAGAEGQVLLVQNSAATTTQAIQNVITWGGDITTSAATPEPSSLAIAGLGILGFLGYGWRRRKSA